MKKIFGMEIIITLSVKFFSMLKFHILKKY